MVCLGPEFGGAIGVTFTLANSIAVAVYLIGFCDSLLDMLEQYMAGYNGIIALPTERVNDIRLLGAITLVLILGLAVVGMDWVTRVQIGLLFLLLTSQVDFIIGSFLPATDEEKAQGFVGFNLTVLQQNLASDYREENGSKNSFFKTFAVFFPAVTGIVAGANLSGDLKDPGSAIPKGTLAAIGTTYVSYVVYAIIVAACSLRDASGDIFEVAFGTPHFNETAGALLNITTRFDDCSMRDCTYGSANNQQMMEVISAWGPLIYIGCFAATLSSAIASLVGAPRVLQAVAKDKLFPYIEGFSEGYGANNDPFRGYILVFVLSLICVLIGDLDQVSSLLSNFFVAAYALINFSVFHASILNSPGWRPAFKYYNKWVSLFGTILCIVVMFLMDVYMALGTFICIILLYMYVHIRKPDANWGSSTQSQSFITALKAVQTLAKVEDHVKNYRPKLLVLSGEPSDRPCLVDFANLLTKRLSLLQFANVVDRDLEWKQTLSLKVRGQDWLNDNHVKAFYAVTRSHSLSEGAKVVVELSGLGKLSPNMLLMGFREDWIQDLGQTEEYFKTLQSAFEMHLAVGVLRINGGLDISNKGDGVADLVSQLSRQNKISQPSDSSLNFDDRCGSKSSVDSGVEDSRDANSTPDLSIPVIPNDLDVNQNSEGVLNRILKRSKLTFVENHPQTNQLFGRNGNPICNEDVVNSMTQFRCKEHKEGAIDVYWLYDDGGLTLLLPHILSTRAKFHKCKLRVFFLSNQKSEDLDREARNMAVLLAKFRIEFQDVVVLSDATKRPAKQTKDDFLEIITVKEQKTSTSSKDSTSSNNRVVSDAELNSNSEKTNFHLRIAEIVRQNSSKAQLIVMTLPLPKRDVVPYNLYMAWLDFTSRNMPPFLLVRGNQESVLTFYS